MKKKITYILLTAALVLSAFFVGKSTEIKPHNADNWYNDYCESEIEIVDYNVGKDGMAMMLSNGIEIYADKSENIYTTRKAYVSFDEIADVETDGQGNVEIVTSDGNVYTLFVTGEY